MKKHPPRPRPKSSPSRTDQMRTNTIFMYEFYHWRTLWIPPIRSSVISAKRMSAKSPKFLPMTVIIALGASLVWMKCLKNIMSSIDSISLSLTQIGLQRRSFFFLKVSKSTLSFIQTRFRELEWNRVIYWQWQNKRGCARTLHISLPLSWWLPSCNVFVLFSPKDRFCQKEIQQADWSSNKSPIKLKRREPPKVQINKQFQVIINSVK